jgi:hypothetical protein
MDSDLAHIAERYERKYQLEDGAREDVGDLYRRYSWARESSLLDAASTALAIETLFRADDIDPNLITPQMEEAYSLQFPNEAMELSLEEKLESMAGAERESVQGFLSSLKGKYFEVVVRDELNAGQQVGDLVLRDGQLAELTPGQNHPAIDLLIREADGSVAEGYQLKATEELGLIKAALSKYPDVPIATTEEADALAEQFLSEANVLSTGMTDVSLEGELAEVAAPILYSAFEEFIEHAIPGSPFVLIPLTEGARVLIGRQTLHDAISRAKDRGIKSAASAGVGIALTLSGVGLLRLPATFVTRFGIDRAQVQGDVIKQVRAGTDRLKELEHSLQVSE